MRTLDTAVSWLLDRRDTISRYSFVARGVVGIAFALFGAYTGRTPCQLVLAGARTTGTIVGHEARDFASYRALQRRTRSHRTSKVGFMPIVEFEADGKPIRFTNWWGRRSAPSDGERVTVLYDPVNPAMAMIDLGFRNWIPWAPVFVVGVLLIISALVGLLAVLRR